MSEKKLTILFTPIDGVGHFLANIGIAEQLLKRGHRVVFAVPDVWKNKLNPQGFEEEWLNPETTQHEYLYNDVVEKMAEMFHLTPEEQLKTFMPVLSKATLQQAKDNEPKLRRIVRKVKPDVIVADLCFQQPAVMNAGIPWILCFSMSPASISSKNVPPAFTGFPIGLKHKPTWDSYWDLQRSIFRKDFEDFQQWVIQNGGTTFKGFYQLFMNYSPYANIYMYPEELDYTEARPNPPNFFRFDTFARQATEMFEIPAELKGKSGKLIYFSMGTIGCSDVANMSRLISILAQSPHRFLVSKGPQAEQIDLAPNMCGAESLPQLSILPVVDLVISHGGNNTLTETFYYGKPIIILPLFGDQLDNAQRVQETGLGVRLHSHKCSAKEFLEAIETVLSDDKLAARMAKIGERMRNSNSQPRCADLIEIVAAKGAVAN